MQQSMLIAPYLCGLLLCVSPALQQLAHRSDNIAVSALVNQEEPNVCRPHIAHAQHMRLANTRQSACLEHTSETSGHVEVVAIGCWHSTRRAHMRACELVWSVVDALLQPLCSASPGVAAVEPVSACQSVEH